MYSGDEVADKDAVKHFVSEYDEKHTIRLSCDDMNATQTEGKERSESQQCACTETAIIEIGDEAWPMAIPIVKDEKTGKWAFDAEAGRDELLSRRIGRNELATIQTCMAIVDAQREYAARDPMKAGRPNYAMRLMSTAGKKDGLYWATRGGEPASPLGPLLAKASTEGYDLAAGPTPYNGYQYRGLKEQTIPGHPKRATVYFVQPGNFVPGFGVVAYPAKYGNSGVMTFIVNQRGVVYQKDLGPDTAKIASEMTTYDPADGWEKAEEGK